MTKTKTRELCTTYHRMRISRHKKTDAYLIPRAFFLMGYIQAQRDLAKLGRAGLGEAAEGLVMLSEFKEHQTLQLLRKL
jgi:hypothetical protein